MTLITPWHRDDRDRLRAEFIRTGLNPPLFFARCTDIPHGLTVEIIQAMVTGRAKTLKVEYLSWVFETLASAPDVETVPSPETDTLSYLLCTEERRAELAAALDQHGLTPVDIITAIGGQAGRTLYSNLRAWLDGKRARMSRQAWTKALKTIERIGKQRADARR